MQRRLILTGPEDKARFGILYTGFLSGGDPKAQKGQEEKIHQLARIKKLLVAVTDEVPEEDRGQDSSLPVRLKDGRQEIILEQRDHELLKKHVINTEWLTVATDTVAEVLDLLSAAEQIPEEEKKPEPAAD